MGSILNLFLIFFYLGFVSSLNIYKGDSNIFQRFTEQNFTIKSKLNNFLNISKRFLNKNFTQDLEIEYNLIDETLLNYRISLFNKKQYEVQDIIRPSYFKNNIFKRKKSFNEYGFQEHKDGTFEIIRNKSRLLKVKKSSLILIDNFVKMDFLLTSKQIYGFGERNGKFELEEGTYSIWPNDTLCPKDDGKGGRNLYGMHPFILHRTNSSYFVGIFFLNSHPQELNIKHISNSRIIMTYVSLGGVIDSYFFISKDPNEIIKDYQNLVGKSNLPPFWSLGWHQSRWGYTSAQNAFNEVDLYKRFIIPVDALWFDIDYMERMKSFTISENFREIDKLSKSNPNIKIITILNPFVSKDKNFEIYNVGKKNKLFIFSNYTSKPLKGNVWPGKSVFFDFIKPATQNYWYFLLKKLQKKINFSGIWLDMNEPSNFVNGELIRMKYNETIQVINGLFNIFSGDNLKFISSLLNSTKIEFKTITNISSENQTYEIINNPRRNQETITNFDLTKNETKKSIDQEIENIKNNQLYLNLKKQDNNLTDIKGINKNSERNLIDSLIENLIELNPTLRKPKNSNSSNFNQTPQTRSINQLMEVDLKNKIFTNYTKHNKYWKNIPYKFGNKNIKLDGKAISINSYSSYDEFHSFLSYKSLLGHKQSQATYNYLLTTNKRPFIISRNTFSGTQIYAGHWLGDNQSTWKSYRDSIIGLFNFQMFGFSMIGADVCGFDEDSHEKLCSVWVELSTFYPFARNHNKIESKNQTPWSFTYLHIKIVRRAIYLRYALLNYLYTCLFKMSRDGGNCVKPLFFEFYNDPNSFKNIERQFLFGESLMIVPLQSHLSNTTSIYFPNNHWNDFFFGTNYFNYNKEKNSGYELKININNLYSRRDHIMSKYGIGKYSLEYVRVFIRGGRIVLFTENFWVTELTTKKIPDLPSTLIINLDENLRAQGSFIFDDGTSLNTIQDKIYLEVKFEFYKNRLNVELLNFWEGYWKRNLRLNKLIIYRAEKLFNFNTCFKNNILKDFCRFEKISQLDSNILVVTFKTIVNILEVKNLYFS